MRMQCCRFAGAGTCDPVRASDISDSSRLRRRATTADGGGANYRRWQITNAKRDAHALKTKWRIGGLMMSPLWTQTLSLWRSLRAVTDIISRKHKFMLSSKFPGKAGSCCCCLHRYYYSSLNFAMPIHWAELLLNITLANIIMTLNTTVF